MPGHEYRAYINEDKKQMKINKQKERTRLIKNEEASLFAFCVALLSQYFKIEIGLPHTHSTKTVQFANIKKLYYENDYLNVEDFVVNKLQELAELDRKDNIPESTISRRVQERRRKIMKEFLEDLLFEYGIIFIDSTNRVTTINRTSICTYKLKQFNHEHVMVNGRKIAEMIEEKVNKERNCFFEKNDFDHFPVQIRY
ncbi:hypothetical protein EHI8A_057240 [Entamoeba histolytica HM-1:IMSS-B]|uniref:Uncharacterized protein n=6 Tax=Entamoeba histolytica TaxID=5759 RepID=C4M2F3_ENTH1|nr:hypothetical protein EHI_158340 [Entamoeba histolytica HM-1:IMSS]EMD42617.1 Hypothetical protein EHI5A_084560 [Entamoeba histolytica KU27]EMH73383.1 hypothetical protein EHI8A_057240 [Entamoeba histolytica HM-1:IMSS-B]EMS12330.1 hypothetical protein KM1_101320 [Entamoeba histolytica HM-3:IMSS]ENY59859.1 hypothetical protein EHI7A_054320 [Entamoeba histolytica HM-1:IMSS-A]GAT95455.1 hypothetical protein CL6EHI_158340 [Entamoeba histolytica]|eukprot:XP_650154.1 hypothetical protein EHI_158340 [Entamoeba histolytica HM-1:IMSS]